MRKEKYWGINEGKKIEEGMVSESKCYREIKLIRIPHFMFSSLVENRMMGWGRPQTLGVGSLNRQCGSEKQEGR